jgi:pyridoxal phosphate enzyme (YggS family)
MIAENIQNIGENLKKACLMAGRNPNEISLIAVSKTFGPDAVREAISCGLNDFGENYVQELTEKRTALMDTTINWHFIGHLQSNKVKYIADWVHMIHSVDSESLAAEIDKRGAKAGRVIKVLIEVNTSEEATKFGVKPDHAQSLIESVSAFSHIDLQGLMTIGPFTDDREASRASFRLLRNIFEEANRSGTLRHAMTDLSMGMSHDYAIAIEEGATMVRIGTAIFGTRTPQVN